MCNTQFLHIRIIGQSLTYITNDTHILISNKIIFYILNYFSLANQESSIECFFLDKKHLHFRSEVESAPCNKNNQGWAENIFLQNWTKLVLKY